MTLHELSFTYEHSAKLLQLRMRELRQAEKVATDSKERRELHRRLAALDPLLREMNELTAHTRRYYERSYCKNEKYSL